MSCRRLAAYAATAVTALVAGLLSAASLAPGKAAAMANPRVPRTAIHHFIAVMQENHTFDNYFGTYPGADGIRPGVCVPTNPKNGAKPCVRAFHIGNRSIVDLGHSGSTADEAFDEGRLSGFVRAQNLWGGNGDQAMGYYDGRDVPFYWNVADRYVLFDHFFSSVLGGSFLNHVYWVAAGPGNATESVPTGGLQLTTIFDELQHAGVSWKFYVQHFDPKINYRTLPHLTDANRASQAVWCPLLDIPRFLNTPALRSHIADLNEYYRDLRDGTLPAVAYIEPSGASEHPPENPVAGQRFVRGLVNSLMSSSAWDSSAFMVTYDDWGGWFDHVFPPPRDADGDGFRVPALLVSPYARRHFVDHTTLDDTSMLKFIEMNWGVRPLTRLDATAGSMTRAFEFGQPPRKPVIIPLVRSAAHEATRSVRDALLYALYGLGGAFAFALIVTTARQPHYWRLWARPGGRQY